jgi:hypothetical protein
MTPTQIKADVDRGISLVNQIETLKAELKTIETRLTQAALEGVTEPLQDDAREGRQFIAAGSIARLPVIIESDQIIASFAPGSATADTLHDLCGPRLSHLYRTVTKFEKAPKDGKAFRATAFEYWPGDQGAKIIAASIQRDKHNIPRSRIVIPWDRAK